MKTLIAITVAFGLLLAADGLAEDKFKIWLWAEHGAEDDPRVLQIEDHCCCTGQVALISTDRMPGPSEGPFVGEKVVEVSSEGKVLNSWYMPIDIMVYGIEGSQIIVVLHDGVFKAVKIDTGGNLSLVDLRPPYESEAEVGKCANSARQEFPDSAYVGCWKYKDLSSGKTRYLVYQGPCT
jgi:hypothetical protein